MDFSAMDAVDSSIMIIYGGLVTTTWTPFSVHLWMTYSIHGWIVSTIHGWIQRRF
jgi:hypothetical protein